MWLFNFERHPAAAFESGFRIAGNKEVKSEDTFVAKPPQDARGDRASLLQTCQDPILGYLVETCGNPMFIHFVDQDSSSNPWDRCRNPRRSMS